LAVLKKGGVLGRPYFGKPGGERFTQGKGSHKTGKEGAKKSSKKKEEKGPLKVREKTKSRRLKARQQAGEKYIFTEACVKRGTQKGSHKKSKGKKTFLGGYCFVLGNKKRKNNDPTTPLKQKKQGGHLKKIKEGSGLKRALQPEVKKQKEWTLNRGETRAPNVKGFVKF